MRRERADLIEGGDETDTRDRGCSVVSAAARVNNASTMRMLLNAGADVNAGAQLPAYTTFTALIYACRLGNLEPSRDAHGQ